MSDPATEVGSTEYLDALDERIRSGRFPDPDPSLVPELTRARFVEAAAREAGDEAFADEVRRRRRPVFEPLDRFDRTIRKLENSDDSEPTPDELVAEELDERTRTFLDYPAPPHDLIESCETRGMEILDCEADSPPKAPDSYEDQRTKVEAVVVGAKAIAREMYGTDEFHRERGHDSGLGYDSADHYADVVAFNAALGAESWLDAHGEFVSPP